MLDPWWTLWDLIKEGLGWSLATAYAFIPSFGIAIILVTFVINTLLFPLTLKQTRSSRAMMVIQPELQRIRREYRDQREEMQRRMTELQREHGASPLGCLGPMLVQSPILFAIFRVLNDPTGLTNDLSPVPPGSALWNSIRAEDATFLGMDLGTSPSEIIGAGIVGAIPYLVTMIAMIAIQYVQQWYTQRDQAAVAGGERQKRQMQMFTRIMPLFLGFISWNFPAGLLLYWTTSNSVRLGQQVTINWMDGRPEPPPGLGKEEKPDSGGSPSSSPHPRAAKKSRRRRRK